MLKKINALAIALWLGFVALPAAAEWRIVSESNESSGNGAVTHRHVVAQDVASGDEATLELAIFSTKTATLRVIDDPDARASLAATMQRENCLAGTNGGYFDPADAPVGLLVSGGKTIAPLRKARLLSGVLSVVNGRVQVQRVAEFSKKVKASEARQCGPFLVDRAQPIAGLNETRSARRTFVATGDTRAALGYCSSVTLAQLAALLASPAPGDFKIQRALNMDGGSSSGFWFQGAQGVFSIREGKTVRDYLGLVPK